MQTSVKLHMVLLVIFYLLMPCNSQNVTLTMNYLDKSLNALQAALQFFDREHETINLDAVLTTKAMEGQLTVLYRKMLASPAIWNVDHVITSRIGEISNLARVIVEKAIPYRMLQSPDYYRTFSPVFGTGFWERDFRSRNIPGSVRIWPYHNNEHLSGSVSNRCLGEILGSRGGTRCDISTTCWRIMTTPGFYGYSLSHQLLYFIFGHMSGCDIKMEQIRLLSGTSSVDDRQTAYCANMLAESQIIADNGYQTLTQSYRDLFMEDAYFCGILGFRQFYRLDWLEAILSWQHPVQGCYSVQTEIIRPNNGVRSGSLVRKKRAEKMLRYGCLSHLTAMAVGSLSGYVRYLLEHLVLLINGVVI